MAIKAYVLLVTEPGATTRVFGQVQKIPGVVEVREVMGPYDIVVEIEVPNLMEVSSVLVNQIRSLDGIQNATPLVTFPDD